MNVLTSHRSRFKRAIQKRQKETESHIVAKRAATGFATLCFGKPRQQQERQEALPASEGGDIDDTTADPKEGRKREIATKDQGNQTDYITNRPELEDTPTATATVAQSLHCGSSLFQSSSTASTTPATSFRTGVDTAVAAAESATLDRLQPPGPPDPDPETDPLLSRVRHAQWSWSWSVKSVKLSQRFVQALLAAHYEFPEMMDKRLLLSHIRSLGRVLPAYAMQQAEFADLEETVREDLLRRNTPIFIQVSAHLH